ncbi:enhanced serine sensitivity protein SseB [Pirellula staleyi DSM 6068]|uniref:Enhanced serine sensitivity protein SseB n=1 Tax=Pirellula staleyi (strain ATCC 27377 / DSM 6068 / ICPB 4128) TaxID=530564 RepID=D2QYT2_PIRSD|nr:enhanced serine sensitivity protein SseB C-terminal domain-containing protein [Pirellula staleyi]ADB16387.1 enhanced serine sensitivity protein SseB [Pirellula staleyi DSM 6068]
MAFTPQNDLEKALVAASKDAGARPHFYEVLLQSTLFVLQGGDAPLAETTRHVDAGESILLRTFERDGKTYIPIFSSLERLKAGLKSNASYLGMSARDLLALTAGSPLVLNPGSDYGKEFTPTEIERLLDGSLFEPDERRTIQQQTEVQIGAPLNYPHVLARALQQYFKRHRNVSRAYLALYHDPSSSDKPNTLVGVELTGDWDQTMAGIGVVVSSTEIPDPPVDFIRIAPAESLTKYFLEKSKPFYSRTPWGWLF